MTALTADLPVVQTLVPAGACSSMGLSYHLADVWLQELKRVADGSPVPGPALLALLEPFCAVLAASGEQALINRVR